VSTSASTDAKIGRAGAWIGLENFISIWDDEIVRLALFNTFFYTLVASVIKFALGLWLALAAESAPAAEIGRARGRTAAVHRTHRAVGNCLLVDLRFPVLDHQLGADEAWSHRPVHRVSR